jgi:C4-dicarboxylate transporter, DctM subunit
MDPALLFGIGIAALLIIIFSGVPVGYAMSLIALGGLATLGVPDATQSAAFIPYKAMNNFVLAAVPLFVLAGYIITAAGMGSRLFDMAAKWLSWMPNGLPIAAVAACTVFGAISGSSVAAVATIGSVAVPLMITRGYHPGLATGVVSSAGTLAVLIPPSVIMIIYSSLTQTSAGALFIAGIIPGLLMAGMISAYLFVKGLADRRRGLSAAVETQVYDWRDRIDSLRDNIFLIPIPFIILGGIYSGLFTPTEAAGVLTAYVFVTGVFIMRSLTLESLFTHMMEAMSTYGMIMLIYVGGMLMAEFTTYTGVADELGRYIADSDLSPYAVVLLMMLILLFLGCVMEIFSIFLLIVPIFYPIIVMLGFDPIWFCILLVLNIEIGMITPPVGVALYVISGITKINIVTVINGAIPFMLLLLLGLIAVLVFPPIATWLPSTMR